MFLEAYLSPLVSAVLAGVAMCFASLAIDRLIAWWEERAQAKHHAAGAQSDRDVPIEFRGDEAGEHQQGGHREP